MSLVTELRSIFLYSSERLMINRGCEGLNESSNLYSNASLNSPPSINFRYFCRNFILTVDLIKRNIVRN